MHFFIRAFLKSRSQRQEAHFFNCQTGRFAKHLEPRHLGVYHGIRVFRQALKQISAALAVFVLVPAVSGISIPSLDDANGAPARIEYYLDIDPGHGNGTPILFEADDSGAATLNLEPDLSNLAHGSHRLYIRTQNKRGDWNVPSAHAFFLNSFAVGEKPDLVRAEYFVGDDPGHGNAIALQTEPGKTLSGEIVPESMPSLPGRYAFGYRVMDVFGNWSRTQRHSFSRLPDFPVTRVQWSVREGETLNSSGTEPVVPAAERFVSSVPIGLLGDTALLGRRFVFQANLVILDKFSTQPRDVIFEILEITDGPTPDLDTDGDGLPDTAETGTGLWVSATDTGTDPANPDTDGDGIPDGVEAGSPLDPNVNDSDVISFFAERTKNLAFGAPVLKKDANGDFVIRMNLAESRDLESWVRLQLPQTGAQVELGDLVIKIPSDGRGLLFYLLRTNPAAP